MINPAKQTDHRNPNKYAKRQLTEMCPRCMKVVACHIDENGPHLGVYCDAFGHWVRWIPKKEAEHIRGA